MKRIVIVGAVVVVLLLAGGLAYLLLSLDAIVERAIEREGTRAVGTAVRVGSVDIGLSEGTGTIRDLRVANPEGFGGGDVFRLEEIELDLDTRSLTARPFRLSRIRVEETTVRLAVDEKGRTNLDRIVRRTREAPAEEPAQGEPTRLAIDRLSFTGGAVWLQRPGADEPERLGLPGFDRTGIGGAEGATGGEIARVVVEALARQVAASRAGREVKRAVEEELGGAAGEAAGSFVEKLLGK